MDVVVALFRPVVIQTLLEVVEFKPDVFPAELTRNKALNFGQRGHVRTLVITSLDIGFG